MMNVVFRPVLPALLAVALLGPAATAHAERYELWVVDQSNSPAKTYGGAIHIYPGEALNGRPRPDLPPSATIDLGDATATLCLAQSGANPVRPHMLFFNSTGEFAILSFVASGHVVIFNAAARQPVACFRMSAGAGGARQAHAAMPSPDDSYILVANQNGKLLERIDTNYAANAFTHAAAATLNLASCTTPNGLRCQDAVLRPDNAPICPIVDATGSLGFVTLRGGGLLVVDPRTTPMTIVAEYDRFAVHGNGCGGAEAAGSMFLDSGGATAANLAEFDVYRFPLGGYSPANPPNTPAPVVVFSDDAGDRDAHGMIATNGGRYIWVADRRAGLVEVFDTATDARANTLDLRGEASADPAPDLFAIAPAGNRVFVSLRGPNPLSGDPHASTGATPGFMVLRVQEAGRRGEVVGVVRISNVDPLGVERADAHGIAVRRR